MTSFGKLIKDLRSKRGLLSKDVAQQLKISLPYLSQLESDRAMPSEELARKIADLFAQDPDEFVFLARRTAESFTELFQSTPRSAAKYLHNVTKSSEKPSTGRKAMVRLIAESPEALQMLVNTETKTEHKRSIPNATMALADVFDQLRPSIVAFASRLVATPLGGAPLFPDIIGTGFVVDSDGIVVTNDHVIEALQNLPPHPVTGMPSGVAIVSGLPEMVDEGHVLPMFFVEISGYSRIAAFSANGPYYGEDKPDLGFVQIKVRGIPALPIADEPYLLRQGIEVATAGFPLGTDPMIPYGKVSQLTPVLRRGIISSLLPFQSPQPHGFTMDIMSQGGASGSPVFLTNMPKVVGIVHAGFKETNLTYAIPSILVRDALNACTNGASLNLSDVPTVDELLRSAPRSGELRWDSFVPRTQTPKK